ncbi:EF-hand domain-containing protein [Aliiroseovarius sp. YM-037]|uniref:EF-hand domain-containing protein n=1 Tax=Aliiroseovarius sp. YM-037 TaxID=3341728 RepID=UPI003A7FE68B
MNRLFVRTGITMLLAVGVTVALTTLAEARDGHRGRMPTFETLDTNDDGSITMQEVLAHRASRFESADTDGDGLLSAQELNARAQDRLRERTARMIERRDTDNDGFLSAEELSPPEGREGRMFNRMDADEDGAISKEEFETATEKRRGRHRGHGRPAESTTE